MAFCVNCGAELEANARFCTYCGSPVLNQENAEVQETPENIVEDNIPAEPVYEAVPSGYANPYVGIIPENPVKKTRIPLVALLCGCAALVLSFLSLFFIDMHLYTADIICCILGIAAGIATIPLALIGIAKGKKTRTSGSTFKCILAVIIAVAAIDIILHF